MQFPAFAEQENPEYAAALRILCLIEGQGFEAWLVGGCIRDALLDRKLSDIDIATNAPWQEVERIAQDNGLAAHRTGIAYGTITVCFPAVSPARNAAEAHTSAASDREGDRYPFEITTFRTDGAYRDARHPDEVSFCSTIEEDLARRDFTMNALAWHPERGLADPYGGAEDIASGIIRAVGDPMERFSEDALRILRGCRFASQLGFAIEERTFRAMLEKKHRLTHIPTERVVKELDGLLLGAHVRAALLGCIDVIAPVLPELCALKRFPQNTPYHCYDVLEHTAHAVESIEPTRLHRWAALLHDIGKPAAFFAREDGISHFFGHARIGASMVSGICARLGLPKAFGEQLVRLVAFHDDPLTADPKHIKRLLARLDNDTELFKALCALKRADNLAHAPEFRQRAIAAREALRAFDEMQQRNEAWRIADLEIDGNDLIGLGYKQGPEIGLTLQAALTEVVEERMPNEREALLIWAKDRLPR